MQKPSIETVEEFRRHCPGGTWIMVDESGLGLPKGLEGPVTSIDDWGNIYANWQNGDGTQAQRNIPLRLGNDQFHLSRTPDPATLTASEIERGEGASE